jgi:hypothetical protein
MYGYHEGSTDASTNSSLEQSIYIYISGTAIRIPSKNTGSSLPECRNICPSLQPHLMIIAL